MASIPSTTELADQCLAVIESETARDAPLAQRATFRVLSRAIGFLTAQLYRYAEEGNAAANTSTARGDSLGTRGAQLEIQRKGAINARMDVTWEIYDPETTLDGEIPIGHIFYNPETDLRYKNITPILYSTTQSPPPVIKGAIFEAVGPGTDYDLEVGATLVRAPEDLENWWPGFLLPYDTGIVTDGGTSTPAEPWDEYRERVLRIQRGRVANYTLADVRDMVEAVPGVLRAWPYSGIFVGESVEYDTPGGVVIYYKRDQEFSAAGVAGEVWDALRVDPETGRKRNPASLPDVMIERAEAVPVYFRFYIASMISLNESFESVRDSFEERATELLTAAVLRLEPWIEGLDAPNTAKNIVYGKMPFSVLAALFEEYNITLDTAQVVYFYDLEDLTGEIVSGWWPVPVGRYCMPHPTYFVGFSYG